MYDFLIAGHAVNGVNGDAHVEPVKPNFTVWVVSSESCAFIGATEYIREVEPGEIIEITKYGIRTVDIVGLPANRKVAFCIFEYVYFAKANSVFEGQVRVPFYVVKVTYVISLARL